ncbi:MAG: sugar transferase [Lachnospiraceae bacterium]|nr:sugar transferase [Lachnospiraceae bacterium]
MQRKIGFYEKYVKRAMDIICFLIAVICFSWLIAAIAVLVKVKLGSPVIFTQPRPGRIDPKTGQEKIFYLYKFRTMTEERDKNGNLLPDEIRLTKFGKALRATSLDELPEIVNILRGELSLVGPRPQLVRDMVFMTPEQRMRHTARPGLSGLAQVSGRNAISWENKLEIDLKYVRNVTFWGDIKIIAQTVIKAFIKREGITENNMATAEDFGDYLLRKGDIKQEYYEEKQREARQLLEA